MIQKSGSYPGKGFEMKLTRSSILCYALALLMLASPLCLASCDDADTETATEATAAVDMAAIRAEIDSLSVDDFEETDEVTEYVLISVRQQGDMVLRLRSDIAPVTVANFQSLVKAGHYNGLTFHRVIPNFMIQGGDPKGNGNGSTTPIKGEMTNNGFRNDLSHIRGVLSMARRGDSYDSGSCQFFICNVDYTYLDKEYATFGYVVAGLDTVDSISAEPTNSSNKPLTDVVMTKVCFVKKK